MREGIVTDIPKASMVLSVWENDIKHLEDKKCYRCYLNTKLTSVRDITKLRCYPRSNVKTRLEQSNLFLASGRFPLQNAIYDNKLPFSRM